jgi:hypothetical protein
MIVSRPATTANDAMAEGIVIASILTVPGAPRLRLGHCLECRSAELVNRPRQAPWHDVQRRCIRRETSSASAPNPSQIRDRTYALEHQSKQHQWTVTPSAPLTFPCVTNGSSPTVTLESSRHVTRGWSSLPCWSPVWGFRSMCDPLASLDALHGPMPQAPHSVTQLDQGPPAGHAELSAFGVSSHTLGCDACDSPPIMTSCRSSLIPPLPRVAWHDCASQSWN